MRDRLITRGRDAERGPALVRLTVGGPRYSEYEIAPGPPLETLVYGRRDDTSRIGAPVRGSAGVGEPGSAVNRVPRAEWVRIPPPPSLPLGLADADVPPKFRRTRLSSGH